MIYLYCENVKEVPHCVIIHDYCHDSIASFIPKGSKFKQLLTYSEGVIHDMMQLLTLFLEKDPEMFSTLMTKMFINSMPQDKIALLKIS
mmetsp:Transcript_28796/g.44232  ORF Transcript_28796/g.44232 Transcript_28796/m.44232 type:complete len:89 (+) Transcript_28796:1055-1321(+)